MKHVFLVDDSTRVILPETEWGERYLTAWHERGLKVVATGEDPDLCERDEAEMWRVLDLLTEY
jgi:hypothetical protein